MGTTDPDEQQGRNRVAVLALLGAAVVVGGAVLYHYLSRPPQMGTSEEAFNTVDALFTAVTARDEKRLGECEQRLHAYRDAGKLPANAAAALDAIIQKARNGAWQPAAERLYDFMLAQRREGVIEHDKHAGDKKGKAAKGKGK